MKVDADLHLPSSGGSFVRKADGTLVTQDAPGAEAVQATDPKAAKSSPKATKEA